KKHLNDCLCNVKVGNDEKREKEVLVIIKRGKDKSFWRPINYVMGKARGESVCHILVDSGDQSESLIENVTQETVEEAFVLITSTGNSFFCRSSTHMHWQPKRKIWATKEICEECAHIWEMITIDSMDTIITKEQLRNQWRGRHESTFHYIAGFPRIESNSYYLEWCWTVAGHVDSQSCWRTKLRSILLMEADYNATNKIIFGQQMLHQMRRHMLIPEEIYSKQN
ncbi:LOW QUALITY PROTEIN: hypothetical protein ACHAXA_007713, partial [Cyclostephanos tholiformis]